MMGLFSCCMTNKRQHAQQDTDTRHARILQIYQYAEAELQLPAQAPPPAYNEVVHSSDPSVPTIYIDKKPAQPRQSRSAASSPRTSVVSIPSTRLTDTTSAHTGGTSITLVNGHGESARSSLAFESAPPSYYDGRSERSTSLHSQRVSDEVSRHFVMSEGWLDVLSSAVERDLAQDVPGAPREQQ